MVCCLATGIPRCRAPLTSRKELEVFASGGTVVETPEPTSKRASYAFVVVFRSSIFGIGIGNVYVTTTAGSDALFALPRA